MCMHSVCIVSSYLALVNVTCSIYSRKACMVSTTTMRCHTIDAKDRINVR